MRRLLGAGMLAAAGIAGAVVAAPAHASAANQALNNTTLNNPALNNPDLINAAPNLVTGVVWQDTNGDGIRADDEPMLAGVPVELKDLKGGTYTRGETDASGGYQLEDPRVDGRYAARSFAQPPPPDPLRDYRIKVIAPAGFRFTEPGAGDDQARDSDIDPATGLSDYGRCEADGCDGADAGLVPE